MTLETVEVRKSLLFGRQIFWRHVFKQENQHLMDLAQLNNVIVLQDKKKSSGTVKSSLTRSDRVASSSGFSAPCNDASPKNLLNSFLNTVLPEKVETKVYCSLTEEQAALYEAVEQEVMNFLLPTGFRSYHS
ncbi:MAG: hypothetical protein H8D34_23130 [Chloroflexi bacterium]|nr:hypothetical protein [Chloroflexota bacterium]MBL6960251.1 hypothetical protein [Anaerolineales bacterium]